MGERTLQNLFDPFPTSIGMLVTVSGPPGSGKSTAASGLAAALDVEHVSGGDIFRELAAERELSLAEFGELAAEDDRIDRNLDQRLRRIARERDRLVLESRLAGWMAGEYADLRIWLDAPLAVRAARIADREGWSLDEAADKTRAREENERRRYASYYNIDFLDRSIYDLAINTSRWSESAVLGLLVDAVNAYDPSEDEGKIPITGVSYTFE